MEKEDLSAYWLGKTLDLRRSQNRRREEGKNEKRRSLSEGKEGGKSGEIATHSAARTRISLICSSGARKKSEKEKGVVR